MIDYNEIIDANISFRAKRALRDNIEVARIVYEDISSDHYTTFNSKSFTNLKPKILTAIIHRQFEVDFLSEKTDFICDFKKVNNFGDVIPELKIKKLKINIARTNDRSILPVKSKYKSKNATLNCEYVQLELDCDASNILFDNYYYALLVFGYNNNYDFFTDLVIPDDNYKNKLFSCDIYNDNSLKVIITNEEFQKKRITLKKSIESMLRNGELQDEPEQ